MRPLLTLLFLFLTLCPVCAQGKDSFADARAWCDTAALDALEGIWLLPADKVYVKVERSMPGEMPVYVLTVVASLDGVTLPGHDLGTLQPSPDSKSYVASLATKVDKGVPTAFRQCTLKLGANGDAMIIVPQQRAARFSFSPLNLLPGFWNMVRLTITPQHNERPKGLVKIYPGYDGNNSNRHIPRYL